MIPLCIAAIEDDHDRFFMEQLYYKYQRLMYSVIQRYTRDPWDADDIFQSTLPKLIDKLTLLKTLKRSKLTNYIISTCKNTAFNYLEKKSNRKEFSLDDLTTFPSSKEDPYQLHLSESDDVDAFRRAWLKLDARSQYLLEARYILNKSYTEGSTTAFYPGSTKYNFNVPIWTIASLGEKMSLVDTSPTPARMLSGQVMIPVYSEQEDTGWNSQYENNMLTLLLPEPATLPIS